MRYLTSLALLSFALSGGCITIESGDGGDVSDDDNNGRSSSGSSSSGSSSSGKSSSSGSSSGAFSSSGGKKPTGGPKPGITRGDCNKTTEGGPVGPGCITKTIKCGETITGHTKGGVNKFDTKFYEKNTCWPGTRNKNGGDERVYKWVFADEELLNGEDRTMNIWTLDTPCADLDLTVIRNRRESDCPVGDNICTMAPFRYGARREVKETVDRGETWFAIIEGPDDVEGPFSLTLECNATRQPNR